MSLELNLDMHCTSIDDATNIQQKLLICDNLIAELTGAQDAVMLTVFFPRMGYFRFSRFLLVVPAVDTVFFFSVEYLQESAARRLCVSRETI